MPPLLVTLGPPIMFSPSTVKAVLGIPNGPFTNTPRPLTSVLANALPVVIPVRSTVVTGPRPNGELVPIFTLPLAPKSIFLASLTVKLLFELSATTPIFLSDKAVVAPPFTVSLSPSLRLTVVTLLSPVKLSPRSISLLFLLTTLLVAYN